MNVPATADPGLSFPWETAPEPGELRAVAEGIFWVRLPLPMALDHVNIYVLEDADGWTLIDTGLDWKPCRKAWDTLLSGPLAAKPVARVLITHHHPDHIGLLGHFADQGAEILATRTAWLFARMLTLDHQERYGPQHITFRQRAGVTGAALEAYAAETPFNFSQCVAPIPVGFRAIREGQALRLGGRDWTVRLGNGHAPDHATLWSDGIVIAGDQVLPGISPNIGVYPTEPEADPLAGWLETCARFAPLATGEQLVLPGHKLPFRGLPHRLRQHADNHISAFERILDALATEEMTAVGLIPTIFKRRIEGGAFGHALVEAVAHVNHLWHGGRVTRRLGAEGAWIYRPT